MTGKHGAVQENWPKLSHKAMKAVQLAIHRDDWGLPGIHNTCHMVKEGQAITSQPCYAVQAKPVVDAGGIFNYARSQGMIKQAAAA